MEQNEPRIVRATVRIEQVSSRESGTTLICSACDKIVWAENLDTSDRCPYCHNDVNVRLGSELLSNDSLYDGDEPIAKPC